MASPINPKYPLFLREINKNNTISGGYPIVTIEDNFNIDAKPNTFYNIKNTADSEVNINFKPEEFYATGKNKHIMFTWDNFNPEDVISVISYIGGVVVEDNSIEGYKYRIDIDGSLIEPGAGQISIYLSDAITEGANITIYTNMPEYELIKELNNIHIINKDINYLYYIGLTKEDITVRIPSIILEEINNDNSNFKYKYRIINWLNVNGIDYMYTNEPCNIATSAFIVQDTNFIEVLLIKEFNGNGKSFKTNEFVFNINSPANIIFNEEIKWNNGNIPDLTKQGIYTMSILDGIGCYTFVNS